MSVLLSARNNSAATEQILITFDKLYIHVTVHHKRRTNYPNLLCYKTLHVSGILSAHHQEFSTVHSALVSFMQVSDDRLQAVRMELVTTVIIF